MLHDMPPDVAFAHGVQNKLSHGSSQAGDLLAGHPLLPPAELVRGTRVWLVMRSLCPPALPTTAVPVAVPLLSSHYCSLFCRLLQDKNRLLQYVPVGLVSLHKAAP